MPRRGLAPHPHALAAAALVAGLLPGCISHPGPHRLEARADGWTTTDRGNQAWYERKVRVIAWFDGFCPGGLAFAGRISNRGTAPVRVAFRPVGVQVGNEAVVGDLPDPRASELDEGTPIRSGGAVEVLPHEPDCKPDPRELQFRLHWTEAHDGDRPFGPDDVVRRRSGPNGVEYGSYWHPPTVGDRAHFAIEITGPEGPSVCDYDFEVVPGPDIVDFEWYQWPLAVVLLPVWLVASAFGWTH